MAWLDSCPDQRGVFCYSGKVLLAAICNFVNEMVKAFIVSSEYKQRFGP
jgi:hypothetical protein